MNASKEEARKALKALVGISDGMGQEARNRESGRLISIQEFLEAAERKLPSEAAYAKDKQRRKVGA